MSTDREPATKGHGTIGRNITISYCSGQRLNNETKEFVDYTIEILGDYNEDRATRFARRLEHDNTIVIYNVDVDKHYYRMDIHKFIELAERTN